MMPTRFPEALPGINADVILSRFRAEKAVFLRDKEMTIFFDSMAHHFSEHASQAVSRGSEAALIPLEKRATLTQPLSQNAPKPAQNFTGADMTQGFRVLPSAHAHFPGHFSLV